MKRSGSCSSSPAWCSSGGPAATSSDSDWYSAEYAGSRQLAIADAMLCGCITCRARCISTGPSPEFVDSGAQCRQAWGVRHEQAVHHQHRAESGQADRDLARFAQPLDAGVLHRAGRVELASAANSFA